jgi:CubicO group peptidase (beta-lactamase class C family)
MSKLLWLWGCALLLSGCAGLQGGALQTHQLQQLQTELDEIAKDAGHTARSGYVLKVRARGELVYSQQVGLASVAPNEWIDEQTTFELASLSKIFTAVAVLQLHELGWLALDQDLHHYLPNLPAEWKGMTAHHLLSHQSGLPDLINQWPRQRLDGLDAKAVLSHFQQEPQLEFAPGTQAAYSNTNYVLLAELVARVSGEDFADYLRQHVFMPADMVSSKVSIAPPQPSPNLALPYADVGKIHGIDYAVVGAINQKSAMVDLENFVQALLQNKLIQAQTLDLMLKPHAVFADGKRYGYGWYIGSLGGWASMSTAAPAAAVGHTGRLGAYRSALYVNRARQFQLIMLSNGGPRTEKLMVNFLQKTRDLLE